LFFTRTGFREDGAIQDLEPGEFFHITTPTWRIGETILEATYIARALDAVDANLICHCRWQGLSQRRLTAGHTDRALLGDYQAEQDSYEATQTVALGALPEALPELVYAILAPLYELFGFFKLPKAIG
jgi:hypothetical protein